MMYIGIDPGPEKSAFVRTEQYKPIECGILDNFALRSGLINASINMGKPATLIIEKPICRKWAGVSISDTAIWAGVFWATWPDFAGTKFINRQKVKMRTVGRKGNDSSIRRYILQRFTENEDEWFNQPNMKFKYDIWQAYALVVVYLDEIGGVNVDVK